MPRKNISQDKTCQEHCESIESSLSHFKTTFKNLNGDAANTPKTTKLLESFKVFIVVYQKFKTFEFEKHAIAMKLLF